MILALIVSLTWGYYFARSYWSAALGGLLLGGLAPLVWGIGLGFWLGFPSSGLWTGDWQTMMAFYVGEIATTGTLGVLMAIIARAFRGKGRRRDKPAP
jgi:hypothetical protein